MALFRKNKPIVFDPYGSRRRSGLPVPRWLLILLFGAALGAGGLYYVQQNLLPARLSPAESRALLSRADALQTESERLQQELATTNSQARAAADHAAGQLAEARAEAARLRIEKDAAVRSVDGLREDLALFELVLPPDPRDTAIGVRAARLANERGQLRYHILLTREQTGGQAFTGVVELVVTGQRANGRRDTVTLDPVEFSLDRYHHLQGSLPLPEGFVARQTTIRVLDRAGGRLQGMRVINVP